MTSWYEILSVIVTGIIGALSGWIMSSRQHRRDDFRTILDERARQVDELLREVASLKALNDQMERRVEGLEAAREDFPFPAWQMSRAGEYIHVNRHFIDRYLTPRGKTVADVLGLKHEDVWNDDVATKLRLLGASASLSPDLRARVDMVDMGDGGVPTTLLMVPDHSRAIHVGFTGYAIDILPAAPPPPHN